MQLPDHVKQAADKAVRQDRTANDVLLDIYGQHEKHPQTSLTLTEQQIGLLAKQFHGHSNNTYQTTLHFRNGHSADAVFYFKPDGDHSVGALTAIVREAPGEGYETEFRGGAKGTAIKGNVHADTPVNKHLQNKGDVFIDIPTIELHFDAHGGAVKKQTKPAPSR